MQILPEVRQEFQHFGTSAVCSLIRGKSNFACSTQCALAFQLLKGRLSVALAIAYPPFGEDAPQRVVNADTCGTELGAIASQEPDGLDVSTAYAGRVVSGSEKRYPSWKYEMLALVWAVRHFRCYLLEPHNLVRTDHCSLE